jgi:hypothetical protein
MDFNNSFKKQFQYYIYSSGDYNTVIELQTGSDVYSLYVW